jgi:hypothetical protein
MRMADWVPRAAGAETLLEQQEEMQLMDAQLTQTRS